MKKLVMCLVGLTVGVSQLGFAHTQLSGSRPENRAMLEAAPKEVMLHFSEPVRLTALAVQMQGKARQSLGPLPPDASEHFVVAAPTLDDGHYTVTWRALSEDTHVMTGEFMFMVGATGDHGQHMNHAEEAGADHSANTAEAQSDNQHGEH